MRTELEIQVELEGLIKESANISPADTHLKAEVVGWIAALKWALEPSITSAEPATSPPERNDFISAEWYGPIKPPE